MVSLIVKHQDLGIYRYIKILLLQRERQKKKRETNKIEEVVSCWLEIYDSEITP